MLWLHEYFPSAIVQIKIYSYKFKKNTIYIHQGISLHHFITKNSAKTNPKTKRKGKLLPLEWLTVSQQVKTASVNTAQETMGQQRMPHTIP